MEDLQKQTNEFFQSLQFKENIDMCKLQALLKCDKAILPHGKKWCDDEGIEHETKNEKENLTNLLNSCFKEGEDYYTYTKYNSGVDYGRVYPIRNKSLGCLRRSVRHFIAGDLYYDIDMINAHFQIALGLCKKYNFKENKTIKYYVENRDEILIKYMEFYDKKKGDVKKLLISILNGMDCKKLKKDEWITKFINECHTMCEVFKAKTPVDLYDILTKNKQLTKQKNRTFISKILQMEEERILKLFYGMAIEKHVFYQGENRCVLCHDGCMVEKSLFTDIEEEWGIIRGIDVFIEELNECVYEEVGYKCDFKLKEMDEGFKIKNILDKNNIIIGEKYIDEWVEKYGVERNAKVDDDDDSLSNLFYKTQKNKYVSCQNILYKKNDFGIYKISSKNALKKDYTEHTSIFDKEYKHTPYEQLTNFALTLLKEQYITTLDKADLSEFNKCMKKTQKYMIIHNDTVKSKMRNTTGQNNIAGSLIKKYTDDAFINKLDINPNLIGFSNGVLDLRESLDKVRKTIDGEYVSMTTGFDFIINDEVKKYGKKIFHIIDSMFSNKDITEFVLKSLAKCLKGDNNIEEWSLFFKGVGSNGKGLLDCLLKCAMGEYHCSLDYKVFTHIQSTNRSVELHTVAKKRYCTVSEPPKIFTINADVFKKWTGNDEITVRNNYATEMTVFKAPTTAFQANHQLKFEGDTGGNSLKRRIVAVEFPYKFCDFPDPKKPNEKKKNKDLKKDCENDNFKMGMMYLLLTYYKKYMIDGLENIPDVIKKYTNEYTNNLSNEKEWFDANLLIDYDKGYSIKIKTLFEEYRSATKDYTWKLKDFKDKLEEFGYDTGRGRSKTLNGKYNDSDGAIVKNVVYIVPVFHDEEHDSDDEVFDIFENPHD
tara:strand:+ start:597 stop:3230 length:2634 start_codon:yes stop_codon:yes gene_type:complete